MKEAAEGIAGWLQSAMAQPGGGYAASIDADADGEEGGFHVWSRAEIEQMLPQTTREIFRLAYGLDGPPNFEDKAWHLVRRETTGELSARMDESEKFIELALEKSRSTLYLVREERVHPTLDDKILTSWNALLAEGFVRAGQALGREDWLDSAESILEFIHSELWEEKQLFAVYNRGEARFAAYLDDHAYLLNAIMHFLQARWNNVFLLFANELGEALLARFEDPVHGGFYFSNAEEDVPIARSMIFQDDATPAGNAIAIMALQKLGKLLGEARYTVAAERALARSLSHINKSPPGFASMLTALQDSFEARPQLIISGTDRGKQEKWKRWAESNYQVDCYLIGLLNGKLPGILREYQSSEPATAWVCHGMKCMPAVNSRELLKKQLLQSKA
jgi:uncharacterized protein YyaL (SSP411 family)